VNKRIWPGALLKVALRGPGKGLLVASAAGWVATAWLLGSDRQAHSALTQGHAGHVVAAMETPMFPVPTDFTAMWLVMIVAMAPPLLLREIGHLWRASLRRMRCLTIAWFLCGYTGTWLLAGVGLSVLLGWVTVSFERIAVAVVVGVLWLCSPARQRCLNACHRVPALRVFGAAAQLDSLRYGVSTGRYCAGACSVVMLLALLVKDYHLAVMAVTTAVTTFERHLPARRPGWRLPIYRGRSLDWPEMAAAHVRSAPVMSWRGTSTVS
jgi:predicted metal-binding membrane protein